MSCKGVVLNSRFARTAAVLALIASPAAAGAQDGMSPAHASLEGLMAEGAPIYRSQCARCHGRNGEGQRQGHDGAPRLSGNFAHLSVREITVRIIRGGAYMPPFHDITDREIAAIATYIRNSFGNSHGIATEEEVAGNR